MGRDTPQVFVGLKLVIWGQSVTGAAGTPQSLLLKGSGMRSVGRPSSLTQNHSLSTVCAEHISNSRGFGARAWVPLRHCWDNGATCTWEVPALPLSSGNATDFKHSL